MVPNPENIEVMKALAQRFGAKGHDAVADKINNAIEEFKNIFDNSKADFSIWMHEENPVTSFYRFDNVAIVTLYKHARGRGNVPTFIAERGGDLYRYIEAEVDGMTKETSHQALAKKIYPSSNSAG